MKTVNVELGDRSYGILIGSKLLDKAADLLDNTGLSKKTVIITNPAVRKLYGNKLQEILRRKGFSTNLLTVPDGEVYKSLDTAGKLYTGLTECFAKRNTAVFAIGGGVIGDLAGFVASTYMRGVPLVQIPTTLLSQVDSSIGGKVAVNHGKLKNKIGTFYQPAIVISDTSTLKTLPQNEFANGMAEVIKSAVIRDSAFFIFINRNLEAIMEQDSDIIEEMVFRAANIKASIVTQDETDRGIRNILNFGHTIGHAIESVSNLKITHGQAVAIGMITEAKIARSIGIFEKYELEALIHLVSNTGLPTEIPDMDTDKILQAMKHDKKIVDGKVRFILPKNIGDVYITDDVDISTVREVISK